MLDIEELGVEVVAVRFVGAQRRNDHPDRAVEFVDGTVGFDAQVILGHPAAPGEIGFTAVSTLGVDLHPAQYNAAPGRIIGRRASALTGGDFVVHPAREFIVLRRRWGGGNRGRPRDRRGTRFFDHHAP